MQLFGEDVYFDSMLKYARYLDSKGIDMNYHSSSLGRRANCFEQWNEPLWKNE